MPITKKDREFAAIGHRRTTALQYWIDTGTGDNALSKTERQVLVGVVNAMKFREEIEAETLAKVNSAEVQEALTRKIRREIAVSFGMETESMLNAVLEKVRKRVGEMA